MLFSGHRYAMKAFDVWNDHISTIEQSRHDQHVENLENQRRDWDSNPGHGNLKPGALFWDHLSAMKAFDIRNDHISIIEQSRHHQHIENLENQRRDCGSNPGPNSSKLGALYWDHRYAMKAFDI